MRVVRDPIRYGFATGRARVLETRLLGRSTFERLLDAATFEDQRRILSETPYGGFLENARTADDIEHALDAAMADMYADFLDRANLPAPLLAYFRAQHDFSNLRAVLKAESLGIPVEELADPLAKVTPEAFITGSGLSAELLDASQEARALASGDAESLDPLLIDPAVDALLYRRLRELALESKSAFLIGFTQCLADLANVKAFLRSRHRSLPIATAEQFFVEGGTLASDRFVKMYRAPLPEAAAAVTSLPLFSGVEPEALLDLRRFDVLSERVVAQAVRQARMVAIGPEPVVAYALSRRAETGILRALLIGRLAGVDTAVLRERFRDVL